jgi:hypothetical protein
MNNRNSPLVTKKTDQSNGNRGNGKGYLPIDGTGPINQQPHGRRIESGSAAIDRRLDPTTRNPPQEKSAPDPVNRRGKSAGLISSAGLLPPLPRTFSLASLAALLSPFLPSPMMAM